MFNLSVLSHPSFTPNKIMSVKESGEDTLIVQYESLQRHILDDLNKLRKMTTSSRRSKDIRDDDDDDDGADTDIVYRYQSCINENNRHLQSLRNVKMNLENINDGDAVYNSIIQSLRSDEKTLIDVNDLLHQKIRLRDEPIVQSLIVPSSIEQYDVVGKFNYFADRVGIVEFRNISYTAQLERLLNINVFQINGVAANGGGNVDVNRVDCAAVLLQALIKDNNRAINFDKFINSDTPLMIEKLKCLMYYLVDVCRDMADNNEDVYTFINTKHYMIDPKTISLGDDNTRLDVNNVFVDKYTPYNKYESKNDIVAKSDESTTYTILYINGKINHRMFDEYATHQDIWYMRCPELYALPHFIKDALGENESYIVRNVKQYNVVTNQSYNTKRVYDADMYSKPLPVHNFLMYESCDYKTYTDTQQSDLKHLDREIAKLMSGIHYEQAIVDETLVFRAGPHNCHDNRTFQFLIEVLVCSSEGSKLYYCASNFEQQKDLNDTLECISRYNISQLYNKLANYNFNLTGPMNFQKSHK
ncbi:ORF52 [Spodoptera exigua multiple nucleopolyhedrovirus]|uniref:ORF52 n=1 Tax=Spodoptera exigua nuclear polyhedrosis virus (strain US) TaxID=31506 RepID=Q9J883_NPVSE|nr:ORF52 [Spodoptera exigua multiple nucleopolyhedrovirus]AAF33582.1 ORF52 [Spodoptera exigua multiple nucleopolyhedrovirus]